MSACELFLEDVVREASVLARVRKTGALGGGEPAGEICAENDDVGNDEAPEVYDCDR